MKVKTLFFTLSISFLFASCTTLNKFNDSSPLPVENLSLSELCPSNPDWETIAPGFQTTSYKISSLNITWHCAKIDFETAGTDLSINYFVSAKNDTYSLKKFAGKTHSIVAINTTPFKNKEKSNQTVGIVKAEKNIYSECKENYSALAFSKNSENIYQCKILENQNKNEIEKYEYAFGGFYQILQDGKILSFNKSRRSRTACATNSEGNILYLFATTPVFSLTDQNGLTYEECAIILKNLGCTDAMQFDGGHSTALIINQKNAEKPFMQRKVAAGIGFGLSD